MWVELQRCSDRGRGRAFLGRRRQVQAVPCVCRATCGARRAVLLGCTCSPPPPRAEPTAAGRGACMHACLRRCAFRASRVMALPCAVRASRVMARPCAVRARGAPRSGQLGHGDLMRRARPTPIQVLSKVVLTKVACGEIHAAALDRWGPARGEGGGGRRLPPPGCRACARARALRCSGTCGVW
jgi:hypothetical protein